LRLNIPPLEKKEMATTNLAREELIRELETLRQRVAELERLEAEFQPGGAMLPLIDENERYRAVFESANDIIILIDKKGKIVDVNGRLKEIGGYEREELVGKNIRSLVKIISKKSLPVIVKNFLKRMVGSDVPPYEVEMFKKNGELVTLEISAQSLRKDGKIVGDLVILRDVTEHKQAEEKYKTILRTALDGFWLSDLEGRFLEVNDAYCNMIGYTREELLEMSTSDIEAIESPEETARHVSNIIEQGCDRFETQHRRKDGETIDVEISVNYLDAEEGLLFVFIRDVTERKQAEEKYKTILRTALDGFWLCNLEGRFLEVNDAYCNMIGYTREELLEMSIPDVEAIETPEGAARHINSIIEQGCDRFETQHRRKDGEIIDVEISVNYLDVEEGLMFVFIRDVTERKQAEELYRTLANSSPIGVYIAQDGKFRFVNPQFQKDTGFNEYELIYADSMQLVHPEDREEVRENAIDMLNGNRSSPYEFRAIGKDGRIIWAIETVTSIRYQGKRAVLGNFMDITEYKGMEEELNLKAQLVDSAGDSISLLDLDANIIYVNETFCRAHGYSREELIGMNMRQLEGQDFDEFFGVRMEEARRKGRVIFEVTHTGKDGSTLAMEVHSRLIKSGDRELILNVERDITERKQAEEALRESEEKFAKTFRASPDAISIVTVGDNRIIDVNEGFTRFCGYTRKEAIDKTTAELCLWAKPEEQDRMLSLLKKNIRFSNEEFNCRTKSGEMRIGLFSTEMFSIGGKQCRVSVIKDITERKQAEKKITRAAEAWRVTFDSITDSVSIIDNDFKLVRVNKAFADAFGKRPQGLIGKPCYEVMHKTNEPIANCPHRKTLQTKKPATLEFFEPTLGISIESTTAPMLNEKGEIIGCVQVARDVTERKQMQEQLMLTDRLASIGELASGVAHELNNPLTSVIGFSQLLVEGDIPQGMKEELGLINSEAQRCASIVKNLLTFARKHAPLKQLSQINDIIEDVLKLRAYEQKVSNIEVERRFASDLPEVMVDYFQMQQVFLNIVINAEYFMAQAHNSGRLIVTTQKFNRSVRVSFTDDGSGISRENLSSLFNPFFTTKEVGKGTGLGLSICHGVVTEHDGRIYARSGPGKGATFIVELPVNK
jgi:PAS domain S-box-containing protein